MKVEYFFENFKLGSDVLHAGIATHYCSSEKIVHLEHALLHSTNANDIDRVIDEFCPKVQSNFGLSEHLDQIEKCFEANSVEEILSKLESDGSEWAKKNIQVTVRVVNIKSVLIYNLMFF